MDANSLGPALHTDSTISLVLSEDFKRDKATRVHWLAPLGDLDLKVLLVCLSSTARSPLYSHISMTIHGLPTIRAFRMESVALGLFHKYQNEHTQGWWLYILGSRWFLLRLNCAVAIFVAIVALTSVPLSSSKLCVHTASTLISYVSTHGLENVQYY